VPVVSYFFGVVIQMRYRGEHNPPHFHAVYAGMEALIRIDTLVVHAGGLPPAVRRKVIKWARLHQSELLENWERARDNRRLFAIAPLEE
jgi:hypothetical protein